MAQDTQERTIYVGSLWHQDCDPFIGVVGFDPGKVETKLAELAQEEYDRCMDVPDDEQDEINIMGSGVLAEQWYSLSLFIDIDRRDEILTDLESEDIAII